METAPAVAQGASKIAEVACHFTPAEGEAASGTFQPRTSHTYDGLNACHWDWLHPTARNITAKLFGLPIASGMLPEQFRTVIANAIPKSTEGFRTSGAFPILLWVAYANCQLPVQGLGGSAP